MNSKELMKKLEVGRVGYGTQSYNDVVVTLTKEETLELLEYIEQLEKHNKHLKKHNKHLKKTLDILLDDEDKTYEYI